MDVHRVATRQLPDRPLPPYSYVSGKFPHPNRDPGGHSYGATVPKVLPFRADDWHNCEEYLWGIDLFNNGYYWEAHEAWEAVWHAAGRRGMVADFCKALIKFAAAGVKAREGRHEGVKRHAQRAKELIASVAAEVGEEQFMGLSLPYLAACAQGLIDNPVGVVDTCDERVARVMGFGLRLS